MVISPHIPYERGAVGVWLGADDGTELFYRVLPASKKATEPAAPRRAPATPEETLDAACWLMPSLPRELIAEILQPSHHEGNRNQ